MILVGNQRGGAKDLARHLMKQDNEHVSVHEVRGFVADDLDGALTESYAISRGTKCKQFLFSLSLNPPPEAEVSTEDFEVTIDRVEAKLGLTGQPRAVVFHEKEGPGGMRRHAHAVWSRIKADEMKAVQMSHSHRKLMDVSRELYLEHGWKMPRGLTDQTSRDPRNFTLEEWQQAKRAGHDAKEIKMAMQDAWAMSDSKTAFSNALEERGLWLARGDRRGFVAVDHEGEVYSLSRWVGVKAKQLRERLGDEADLSSVDETTARMATAMSQKLETFQRDLQAQKQAESKRYETKRMTVVAHQRAERQALSTAQAQREVMEHQDRQSRLRSGVRGLWDRLTGTHKRTVEMNDQEAALARQRDLTERDQQVFAQLKRRREMVEARSAERENLKVQSQEIVADVSRYQDLAGHNQQAEHAPPDREERFEAFKESRRPDHEPHEPRGPTLER